MATSQVCQGVWKAFLPPGVCTPHSLVSSANLTEGGLSSKCHRQCSTVLLPVLTLEAHHSSLVSTWASSHPLNPCLSILEKRMLYKEISNSLQAVQVDGVIYSFIIHQCCTTVIEICHRICKTPFALGEAILAVTSLSPLFALWLTIISGGSAP